MSKELLDHIEKKYGVKCLEHFVRLVKEYPTSHKHNLLEEAIQLTYSSQLSMDVKKMGALRFNSP